MHAEQVKETGEESRRKEGHQRGSQQCKHAVPRTPVSVESIFAWHRCVNEVDRLAVPAPNINLRALTITTKMTTRPEGSHVIPLLAPPVYVLTRVYAIRIPADGAHRSLRAIKHESHVTFIPL